MLCSGRSGEEAVARVCAAVVKRDRMQGGSRGAICRAAVVTWACMPGMEGRRDCGRGSRPGVARARETELPAGPGCQRGEAETRAS